MSVIARFGIDGFEARQVSGLDVDWFGVLTFAKTFTAGVVGTATTVFLASGEEGNRAYLAVERITGRLEGETAGGAAEGAVTVHHGGLESDPDATFGHIVPGTGTGPFTGWQGSARIAHDDDGAFFVIDLV
jgi:hypothetical protein